MHRFKKYIFIATIYFSLRKSSHVQHILQCDLITFTRNHNSSRVKSHPSQQTPILIIINMKWDWKLQNTSFHTAFITLLVFYALSANKQQCIDGHTHKTCEKNNRIDQKNDGSSKWQKNGVIMVLSLLRCTVSVLKAKHV